MAKKRQYLISGHLKNYENPLATRLAVINLESKESIASDVLEYVDNIISNGDEACLSLIENARDFRMSRFRKYIPIFLVDGIKIDINASQQEFTFDDIPNEYQSNYSYYAQPSVYLPYGYSNEENNPIYPNRPCILLCPERVLQIVDNFKSSFDPMMRKKIFYALFIIREFAHVIMDRRFEEPESNWILNKYEKEKDERFWIGRGGHFYETMWANRIMLNYISKSCSESEYKMVEEFVALQPAGYRDAIGAVPDGWKTWLELKRGKVERTRYNEVIAKCKVI